MIVFSWNVNGIRTLKQKMYNILHDILKGDIICLQETKLSRNTLDEEKARVEGYNSYFSFSKNRTGYSGVATYCRDSCTPLMAVDSLVHSIDHENLDYLNQFTAQELKELDSEGRVMITLHKVLIEEPDTANNCRVDKGYKLAIINVYCVRADPEKEHRKSFKLRFYHLLELKAMSLLESGMLVLIVGDINTAHKPEDSCDHNELEDFNARSDRQWMDQFLWNASQIEGESGSFVDVFRKFHPNEVDAYTCWCIRSNSRQTNYGRRIDYCLADMTLTQLAVEDSTIMPDIMGSDHCPISCKFTSALKCIPASKCPGICTKYWPEFGPKQQKLSAFFSVKRHNTDDPSESGNSCKKISLITKQPQPSMFQFFDKTTAGSSTLSPPTSTAPLSGEGVQKNKGSASVPVCKGHKEPCALKVVKKPGLNKGKEFYCCARGEGRKGDPAASCNHFIWVSDINKRKSPLYPL